MISRKKFIDRVQKNAAHNFLRDGHLTPMFLGVQEGRLLVMPLVRMDKDRAAMAVHALRRACTMAATVMESWMASQDPAAKIIQPSAHPNKKEILMMVLYEGEKISAFIANIVRDADGKPRLEPWMDFPKMKWLAGRFGDGTSVSEAMQPWRQ